jgi:hypothetical protein
MCRDRSRIMAASQVNERHSQPLSFWPLVLSISTHFPTQAYTLGGCGRVEFSAGRVQLSKGALLSTGRPILGDVESCAAHGLIDNGNREGSACQYLAPTH